MIDFNQYFKGLKKTIEGKDNYYFLVNDTNNEIRQHYDYDYQSSIDIQRFVKSIASKKDYFYTSTMNSLSYLIRA